MGAHVFAIASGEDGVALTQRLGAEVSVEGHDADAVASSVKDFAPDGFDVALLTSGGEAADSVLTNMKDGGRVAYPWHEGQRPVPNVSSNVQSQSFNASPDQSLIEKLNNLIEASPFDVHLGGTFSLDKARDAFQALDSHYLGRLALFP